jgi:hypothetical protein
MMLIVGWNMGIRMDVGAVVGARGQPVDGLSNGVQDVELGQYLMHA